mgnify:CR=1 FL=1
MLKLNKKNIRFAGIILFLILAVGVSAPVHAETKDYFFDLLVVGTSQTKAGATKAGGSSFENRFYVTQTFTEGPANCGIQFVYHPRYNGAKAGNNVKLSYSKTTKKGNNTYLSGQALAGRKYQLRCKAKSSIAEGEYARAKGRWTP